LLQGWFSRSPRFQKTAGNRLFAILLFFGLLGPYVKPIFRAPFWDQFRDQWSNDVCLQTSESSCGPACAATLLRQLGHPMTEMEIARESFTSRHGTENWYLARTLRRHGATVEFVRQPDPAQPWPHPAIAGVRMQNTGHFITILGRQGDQYTIGDPIGGRHTQSQAAWSQTYEFTGFFLVVK
jgi:ABC-type bacteriocin/lantibiotic exporter with double-glycine peptidase domain